MPAPFEPSVDWIGFAGSACVLVAFCMKRMIALRLVAIAGNLLFLCYASTAGVAPILVMNALLLPLNIVRLRECVRAGRAGPKPALESEACTLSHPRNPAVVRIRNGARCFAPLV